MEPACTCGLCGGHLGEHEAGGPEGEEMGLEYSNGGAHLRGSGSSQSTDSSPLPGCGRQSSEKRRIRQESER